jgi:predicted AAA+ superfamily ATPase
MPGEKLKIIYDNFSDVKIFISGSSSLELKTKILKNIFSLYVEKDVAGFFGITETSKFEDLVKVLAFNISNLISISSLSSELKISYDNVEKYLEILKHTYIISLLKPFFKNLTTEIKKASKIYFLDLGLRNCAIDNFLEFDKRVDKGELSENFVFREILSNFEEWKINFWRTTGKAEIDFIARKNEKIVPIEVKLAGEKLGKGFYSFIKSYKPEKAIIVSLDGFEKKNINKTLVQKVPIYYF